MSMSDVEKIEYKGEVIEIHQDCDAENPREWENLGTMVCWHRSYALGDKNPYDNYRKFKEALAGDHTEEDLWNTADEDLWPLIEPFYVILALYLYDHSGLSLSTAPFSCGWDSGAVGFIYCSLEDVKKNWAAPDAGWDTKLDSEWGAGRTIRECAEAVLQGEVKTYDQYLRGEVYGYVAGEDSCWGYFGSDHKESGLLEQAQSAIDYKLSQRKRYVCPACGGDRVARDATAKWNIKEQAWELQDLLSGYYCMDCLERIHPWVEQKGE